MAAALALLILLAGSLVIVRVASVILRLTGLPEHVARFQSISALTGAGFTTTESEAIVNFPIRRKVIVGLMLLGNLGIVSVVSTIIVALTDSIGDTQKIAIQAAQIAAAVAVIALFMMSRTLDQILCGTASKILRKFMNAHAEDFDVLLAMGSDHCVGAHVYRGNAEVSAKALLSDATNISILAVMGVENRVGNVDQSEARISRNETLICFATMQDHRDFAHSIKRHF